MQKCLVIVGCQSEKLAKINKKDAKEIMHYIHTASHTYETTIAIVRKDVRGSRNLLSEDSKRAGNDIVGSSPVMLDYEVSNLIVTPGYDVDVTAFRNDIEYDIIGVSTAAAVLSVAMSLYSRGCKINVLKDYVADRKGPGLQKAAFLIMENYMPGVLK